jgi:hypothetical protein
MEQQQEVLHPSIRDGLRGLSDEIVIEIAQDYFDDNDDPRIDRRSWEHLIHVLEREQSSRGKKQPVKHHLKLKNVKLPGNWNYPSDGSLDVLRSFFARSDTTVTRVTLWECDFGTAQEASLLLAAFRTNRTVTDLCIKGIDKLRGAAFGNSLSGLLQNMSQLERLDSAFCDWDGLTLRALLPGLRSNRTLKQLTLTGWWLRDEGMRLCADALVGNTTMEVMGFRYNYLTSNGLDDIMRMIESMPRLHTITIEEDNNSVFNNVDSAWRFVARLIKNTTIQ